MSQCSQILLPASMGNIKEVKTHLISGNLYFLIEHESKWKTMPKLYYGLLELSIRAKGFKSLRCLKYLLMAFPEQSNLVPKENWVDLMERAVWLKNAHALELLLNGFPYSLNQWDLSVVRASVQGVFYQSYPQTTKRLIQMYPQRRMLDKLISVWGSLKGDGIGSLDNLGSLLPIRYQYYLLLKTPNSAKLLKTKNLIKPHIEKNQLKKRLASAKSQVSKVRI